MTTTPTVGMAESMFQNVKRYLMAEADAGSGNGAAVPAPAPTENVSQAQGDAVTLSKVELEALVADGAAKAVAAAKDAIFAEARRTFTGKKEAKPAKADDPPPTPQPTTPDPMRMRALDRALSKHGFADKLSDSQYARVEKLFVEESPDDAAAWVKDYFDGFGVAQSAAQPPQQAQAAPQKPVSEHPVSNRGAPPPTQTPLEEMDLWTATDSDRAAYLKSKGPKAFTDLLRKQGKGRPVRF